jgi:hypothetical protein
MADEFGSAITGRKSGVRSPVRSGLSGAHFRNVAARLHDELSACDLTDQEGPDGSSESEPLFTRVARAKARWLRRVMYGTVANSTEKCFAYAVADHLNCVTLDAWPGQARLAQILGFKSFKTIQRAAAALQDLEVLIVRDTARQQFRYAPVFLPGDEDRIVRASGQLRAEMKDTDVHQSLLLIPINSSSPRKRSSDKRDEESYRASQRGAIEVQIAAMLGDGGIELLFRLGAIDDSIVERLCRAHAAGALGERELIAARLAAQQVRSPGKPLHPCGWSPSPDVAGVGRK